MTADDTERLRAWQALGWARGILGYVAADRPGERAAYERGLRGEPPPCGCVEKLRECERRLRADLDDGATYTMSQVIGAQMEALRAARAALGDTEAVE